MKKQSLLIAYHFLSLLMFPAFCLFLLGAVLRRPAYRRGMAQRFGIYPPDFFKRLRGKKVLWIHAASVGEVMMSRSFIHTLRALYPNSALVFSTITPSGQDTARKHLKGIALHLYFPFDLLWIVRTLVSRMQPSLFIFLETEIWANCLKTLSEKKIPSVMINGRISERSFPRYKKFRPFFLETLGLVSAFLMQSDQDAERILHLGASPDCVVVTGNMKYDQAGSEKKMPPQKSITLASLALSAHDWLMIAGSTRPGEEKAVLEAYRILQATLPSVRLLMAPRHLQRLDEVEALLTEEGFEVIRKTKIADSGRAMPLILLDTLGELEEIYGLGVFIFIGGGLAPFGGHNPLEAAAHQKPVFFGPHMENFKEIAAQLKASGGGIEVETGKGLGEKMAELAENPAEFRRRGEAAMQVVLKHRGAVKRNLDQLARWMPSDLKPLAPTSSHPDPRP